MKNKSEFSLADQIKMDRILAYLLRDFCEQGEKLMNRPFPALPRRDKACAQLLWELLKAGIVELEWNDEKDRVFLKKGPKRR